MSRRIVLIVTVAATLFAHSAQARPPATMPKVERTAAGEVVISWSDISPVDVYVADRPDASIAQASLVSDDDTDGRHQMPLASAPRRYFILRKESDGSILKTAERVLPLEHGSNFRDIGGYPAAGGKHVRWGMIYRSGATALLSERDIEYIERLGIKGMIDLRSVEERQLAPTRLPAAGIHFIASDYSASTIFGPLARDGADATPALSRSMYRDWPTSLAPQYRAIFEELLSGRGAIAYNCSAGQDRTGVATALVLSALGVPRDIIFEDYHLSTIYRHPENEMPNIDPAQYPNNPVAIYFAKAKQQPGGLQPRPLYLPDGRAQLAEAFDEIETGWGSVENYLDKVLHIDRVELAALRGAYLE